MGANNKEELAVLYKSFVALNVEEAKKKGTIFKDETTCYVEGNLKVGKDVRIGSNVTIKGDVKIGNDVSVESNVVLANVNICLLYTSPSPRDKCRSRMPSSA